MPSGLKTLERKLNADHFRSSNAQDVFSKLTYDHNVDVRMPKFKMTQPIHPKKLLVDMGSSNCFFIIIKTPEHSAQGGGAFF